MLFYRLRGLISDRFGTQAAFAEAVGLSPAALSARLNGATEWTRSEIEKACTALDIPLTEAAVYFFCSES
jgi:transcriptional regulator with XRE-family HTH domain